MKKLVLIVALLATSLSSFSQMGIGTDSPDASAVLDLTSTTKGFLPPRMTLSQMNSVASPVEGLLIYCTDCSPRGFFQYTDKFQRISFSDTTLDTSTSAVTLSIIGKDANDTSTHSDITIAQLQSIKKVTVPIIAVNQSAYRSYIDDNPSKFSSPATVAEVSAMLSAVNATAPPAVSAINASGKIDAITFDGRKYEDIQPNGLKVSYTGGNGRPYDGSTVESTGVTGLTLTLAAGTLAKGSGNLEYKLSGTASDNTGVASFAISFLGENETKTFTLNEPSLSRNPINHGDCGGMISDTEFKRFACHNLGVVDTNLDPNTSGGFGLNGAYYQWGKKAVAAEAPISGNTKPDVVSGWSGDLASNGSWNSGTEEAPVKSSNNDPCPAGFRIPTNTEWLSLIGNNNKTTIGSFTNDPINYGPMLQFRDNASNAAHNLLSLPASGYRYSNTGALNSRGELGFYWSSTESGDTNAYRLRFESTGVLPQDKSNRKNGFSVRCVAE